MQNSEFSHFINIKITLLNFKNLINPLIQQFAKLNLVLFDNSLLFLQMAF